MENIFLRFAPRKSFPRFSSMEKPILKKTFGGTFLYNISIMANSITVILPCFNENRRILPVINQIKKIKIINEIIVVDDGSDNSTSKILQKITGIKLITHSQNKGKTEALKTGINNTKSDIIAFIDSDLINFKDYHLKLLLNPVLKGKYDLVLGEKEKESFHSRITSFSIAFTGERIIKRKLLLKYPEIFDNKGYLVEASMNKIFFKLYKVGKVCLQGVGQWPKIKKIGLNGAMNDIKMLITIIKFLGLKNFFYQLKYAQNLTNC